MATQIHENAELEHIFSYEYARKLDLADPPHLREEFIIPTKADLTSKSIAKQSDDIATADKEQCTYLCGNSLGLQPVRTREYILKYLDTWATKGVYGHFKELNDSFTSPWLNLDDDAKESMGKILGALPDEVAIMETLTANLHLLMASFYKPTKERYKIIIEGKAFPSDHYATLSQLAHHNLPPSALITIAPPNDHDHYLPTDHICSVIKEHASSTALVLLPGIQYYTGQFFDIPKITKFAHGLGLTIGWDLAHAVGNVPLFLHDWDVDFAAWCSYKYLNSGPGSIGGLFVHERHGRVEIGPNVSGQPLSSPVGDPDEPSVSAKPDGGCQSVAPSYRPRLSGWWGHDKSSRFIMGPDFVPIAGASGFQVSNPSVYDITSVLASLSVFDKTTMQLLRERSLKLTGYLESLLQEGQKTMKMPCRIITPSNPEERGAQISVILEPNLLDVTMEILEQEGVVIDERKPDVIRVAPAPLYNTFKDVLTFYNVFVRALQAAVEQKGKP